MSQMFEQYDNLSSQYIPSNMNQHSCVPKINPFLETTGPKKPYEEVNAEGQVIGYWWGYGDTINLEFELSGNVTLDESYILARDFIKNKQIQICLYNFRHEQIQTKLFDGNDYQYIVYKQAPYVNDKTHGLYYIYEDDSYKQVQLPDQYDKNTKYYEEENPKVIFTIDKTMSLDLVRGVYYCSVSIIDNELNNTITLINQDDLVLTVR